MRKLFQLVGEISIAGIDLANKQMRTMDKEARKVQRSIATFGKNMEKTGLAMTKYVTLPLLAAGGAVIKFGADFDGAMTKSLAIMGDLSEAMKKDMSMAAREVGKATKFSATQAAEAYYFLASAGLSAAQSIKALPKVAAFAQAGQFGLALATDLLTDAQSALGLVTKDVAKNMENMTRVSDVLVKANTLSNASVQLLSEALTNKAGAALKALGKDVEEGVAVLAAFAAQGIKGAEAGTKLFTVLRDLQTASIKNAEAFKTANIAVYDSNDEMRNMADIMSDLENRFEGMSDKQRRMELMTLGFTDKSIAATEALLGTSDAIREYEKGLRNAAGVTDEVAKKQLADFWSQLGLVKDELIDVGLTIWQTVGPILTKVLIPALKEVIKPLKVLTEWFDKLNKTWKEIILTIVAVAFAAGPLLFAFGKIILATKALSTAIITMNAALLVNPFALAAAAIALIVIAATSAYYWLKNMREEHEKYAEFIAKGGITKEGKRLAQERVKELEAEAVALKAAIKFAEEMKETTVAWQAAEGFRSEDIRVARGEYEAITDQISKTKEKIKELKVETIELTLAERMAAEAAKITAATKKAVTEKELARLKELKEKREEFEEGWTKKLFNEIASREQVLREEMRVQLEIAGDSAQARADIEQFYSIQFARLEEEKTKKLATEELKRTQIEKRAADEIAEIDLQIANTEKELADLETERKRSGVMMAIEGVYQLADVIQGFFDNRMMQIDQETLKKRKAIEDSIMSEEDKNLAFEALDEAAAKKKKKILRKQALLEKAMALFSIGVNTAAAIMKGFADLGPIGGIVAAILIGLMAVAQTAVVLAEPLPMRRGAYVRGGMGGVQAEIGEGVEDEIVLPMKTGVQALAEALVNKLNEIKLPEMRTPKLAMAGGGIATIGGSRKTENHFHIGTLIADESGIKELQRRLNPYYISDEQRKGRLYHGSR